MNRKERVIRNIILCIPILLFLLSAVPRKIDMDFLGYEFEEYRNIDRQQSLGKIPISITGYFYKPVWSKPRFSGEIIVTGVDSMPPYKYDDIVFLMKNDHYYYSFLEYTADVEDISLRTVVVGPVWLARDLSHFVIVPYNEIIDQYYKRNNGYRIIGPAASVDEAIAINNFYDQ